MLNFLFYFFSVTAVSCSYFYFVFTWPAISWKNIKRNQWLILQNIVCFMFTAIRLIVKAAALFPVELNTDGCAQKRLKWKLWPDCTSFQKTAPVSSVSSAAATLRAIFSPQAQLRVKKNICCLHTTHGGDKYPAGYPHDTAALFWLFLPAIKMKNCGFSFLSMTPYSRRRRERKKEEKIDAESSLTKCFRSSAAYNRLKEMSGYFRVACAFSSHVIHENDINVEYVSRQR